MRLSLTSIFIIWVLGFGTFSIVSRNVIAKTVSHWKAPRIVKYYLIVTPIIMLEEALTIETSYFWNIIPMLFTFYLFFLPLYFFQRFTRISYLGTAAICGLLGWVNEFILVGRIQDMQGIVVIVMSILCWLIYAVMAILPSAYLQMELDQKH